MILLNVLALTNEFEEEKFGGAGTAVTGMINMFDRLGVEQTVIIPRSDWSVPGWYLRGQQIKVLGLPRNNHFFGYLGMIKTEIVLQEFPELNRKWDLIHSHAINFTPLAYTLSGGVTPILYTVYSFLRQELGNRPELELQAQFKIQEELLMRCQCIHLISESERIYLAEHFPNYLPKAEVLPIGITWPAQCWRPGGANDFLFVGRLLAYKGIEDLILALSILRKNGGQAHLNVIGQGTDYYINHLKKMVQSRKLEAWIKFHGWRPDLEVEQWMECAAGLIVPSRSEAYGLVALEAMAVGTPLIASRAGGLAELVSDAWAITFEAGNVEQLSAALKTALDRPSELKFLAVKGREKALSLEWGQLASKYWDLIKSVKR